MTQLPQRNDPIIPPIILLIAAAVGFLVAFGSAFVNQQLGFAGFAGLIIAVLSLIFWALTNPDALKKVVSGRFLQFGGTALVFVIVMTVAFVLIYIVIRQFGWRTDLSQSNNFSLDATGAEVVALVGQDPTAPNVLITAFYGTAQASSRDLIAVLLDDIANASNGKVTYRFVDPDRDPLITEQFGAQTGQAAVSALAADGTPDADNTQLISAITQQTVLDALVAVSATGDFHAYVLATNDGISITDAGASGASLFAAELTDKYKWTVTEVTPLALQTGEVTLTEGADGRVLIIPGGRTALPDEQIKAITDYMDAGGSVVLFADFNTQGQLDLATAPALNDYLAATFGVRINNDLMLDQTNNLQDPTSLVTNNFGTTSLTEGYDPQNEGIIFTLAHSLSIAPTLPDGATASVIVSSNTEAYARTGLDLSQEITLEALAQTQADTAGAYPLGVQAENANTGARLIVYASPSLLYNQFRQFEGSGGRNFDLARRSVFWGARYENYAANLASVPTSATAQDQPIIATDSQISTINFFALVVLPFGVLAAGVWVWYARRERAIA